jgi:hypothetical protein
MNYKNCMALVKSYLPSMVAKTVRNHHMESDNRNGFFLCWLRVDAGYDIADIYVGEFKKRFGDYITPKIENDIRLMAGTVPQFLKAYVHIGIQDNDLNLPRMCRLVCAFVEEQLEDFENWYSETCLGMPDEEENDS